jgi:hypothetical protein
MWLLVVLLAGLNLVVLGGARKRIAGTTLVAPWGWAAAVLLVLAGSECAIAASGAPLWGEPLRYAAAMITFTPAMAVLGAKRPQNAGWQWVVLTLWLVLMLPAAQTVVFGSGPRVAPFVAWKLLVAALVGLELVNYAFSRHRWAVALFVAAQAALLWSHFRASFDSGTPFVLLAMVLITAATLSVSLRRPADANDCWRRFVDWYGAFWSFRVMSLVNQTADAAGWPVRLMPFGFIHNDDNATRANLDELPAGIQIEIDRALRNTLRRFLSDEMLDRDAPPNGNADERGSSTRPDFEVRRRRPG